MEGQEYLEDQNNEQSRHMPRSIFEQESNTQSMMEDLNRRSRRIGKQIAKVSEKLPPAPNIRQSSHVLSSSANAALKMQGKMAKRKLNDSQVISDENNSNEPNNNGSSKQEHNSKELNTVY